jgi:transcriptional regulator with XRE-family HTH domain
MHKSGEAIFVFYDKFKLLCEQKGVSAKRAVTEMGLSNSLATKWKNTGATPNSETLKKITEYFGVSVAYLLGTEEKPATNEGNGLSKEAIEMGRIFDAAAPEIKERMKDVIEGKATIKTAVNVVNVKCPLDGTMQKIYQNVIKVDNKAFPNTLNNGCEMYHPCQECEVCRMRAMFAELKGFGK